MNRRQKAQPRTTAFDSEYGKAANEVATAVHVYYVQLQAVGFDALSALELAKGYQDHILNLSVERVQNKFAQEGENHV